MNKVKMEARDPLPLPGQPPVNGQSALFNPETTVTFVRKKAERSLNDAMFVDNMPTE